LQLDQGDRYGNCEKGRSGQEGCTGEEGRTSEEGSREEGRPGEEGCASEEGCAGEEGSREEGRPGEEGCCEEGGAREEGSTCEEGRCSQETGRQEAGRKESSKKGGAPSARCPCCPCGKDGIEPGCGLALPDRQQALRLARLVALAATGLCQKDPARFAGLFLWRAAPPQHLHRQAQCRPRQPKPKSKPIHSAGLPAVK
jgi:hypothetical protein